MKKLTVIFLLLLSLTICYAQDIDQAFQYFEEEKYELAALEFESLIPEFEEEYGKNDTSNYGYLLLLTAMSFENCTIIEKATHYYSEYISLYERLNAVKDPMYLFACTILAALIENIGFDPQLEHIYIQIKNAKESETGKFHPEYALACSNLAFFYFNSGNYIEAVQLYIETNEIYKDLYGIYHYDYSMSCSNLANVYRKLGMYQEAEDLFLENKVVSEKLYGKEHPDYAICCSDLGLLYLNTTEYQKAEPLLMEAKFIRENILGTNHEDYASSCNNLALLYNKIGNYQKAESLYKEARDVYVNVHGKQHLNYATNCINLAAVYSLQSRYLEAEELLLEAKLIRENILGKDHPDFATSCNNLAELYRTAGNFVYDTAKALKFYHKAEPLSREANSIYKNCFGTEHPTYATSCDNLATLYSDIGMCEPNHEIALTYYLKAESLYLEAIRIREKKFGKEHPSYATSCMNLAIFYSGLQNSSFIDNQDADFGQKAEKYFIISLSIFNKNIQQNFSFLSESEKEYYFQTLSSSYEVFNSFAIKREIDNSSISSSVYNNSLTNKSLLLKSSISMRHSIFNSGNNELITTYKDWQRINAQLAQIYTTEKTKRIQNPTEIEAKANELEKILVKGSNEISESIQIQNTNWQDIREALRPGEVAIEFTHFDYFENEWTDTTIYCAVIIKPESQHPEMIQLFIEDELGNYINYSKQVSDANLIANLYGKKRGASTLSPDDSYVNYADSLYALIWSHIDPYLEGTETVYYSPSGLLHNISFAAIPYNDSSLLSDNYDLVYLSSTANLVLPKEPFDINNSNVAIYGGLYYDADTLAMLANAYKYNNADDDLLAMNRSININDSIRGGTWNYLKGTLDEAENINAMFKENSISTKFFYDSNGIEESFKSLSGNNSPEIIHLATHGFFFPDLEDKNKNNQIFDDQQVFKYSDNPLIRSGLILSGANNAWNNSKVPDGIDDGILTAYEVSGLDLYNTNLVVLSACETGLGDIKGSEGVYGLQRAFKMAGVDYLIMSLWQVPDKETQEFMGIFYEQLLNGSNIRKAFIYTQKEMKKKYDPYYWAAFVLME